MLGRGRSYQDRWDLVLEIVDLPDQAKYFDPNRRYSQAFSALLQQLYSVDLPSSPFSNRAWRRRYVVLPLLKPQVPVHGRSNGNRLQSGSSLCIFRLVLP